MDEYVGIVCGQCDAFNRMNARTCTACGHNLAATDAPPAAAPSEEPVEQARNYVCKECSSPVPAGHKFCGSCGAAVPPEIQNGNTEYFSASQEPGKGRLVLIRGDQGAEGMSYLLQAAEHLAGREQGQILFPEDTWMSPSHANFLYRGDKLVVRDEGSTNGVYLRITGPVEIRPGDAFLCGEQVFRIEVAPADDAGPEPDQTYFYASPAVQSTFRIVQILGGGLPGMVHCVQEGGAIIGREESDLNFPTDVFMSGNHAKVEHSPGGPFVLTDLESRNGTYVRIDGERELVHGDYLFMGKQLLRVEMTA